MEKPYKTLLRFYRKNSIALNELLKQNGFSAPYDEREFLQQFKADPQGIGDVVRELRQMQQQAAEDAAEVGGDDMTNVEDEMLQGASSGIGGGGVEELPAQYAPALNTTISTSTTKPISNVKTPRVKMNSASNFAGDDSIIHHMIKKHPLQIKNLLRRFNIKKEPSYAVVLDAIVLHKNPFVDELHKVYTLGYDGADGSQSKITFGQIVGGVLSTAFGPAGAAIVNTFGIGKGKTAGAPPPPPPPPPAPPKKDNSWMWAVGTGVVLVVVVLIAMNTGKKS